MDIEASNPPMFPIEKAPLDADGFVVSFSLEQTREILEFFLKYGFVVIANILTREEREATVEDIWKQLENQNNPYRQVLRSDPSTWDDDNWPLAIRSLGLLGYGPATSIAAWKNRINPNLHKAFSTVMETEDLWVSVDRYGVMRPTKGIRMPKLDKEQQRRRQQQQQQPGEQEESNDVVIDNGNNNSNNSIVLVDRPDWKTKGSWLHWDLNPWVWTLGITTKSLSAYRREAFSGDFTSEHNDNSFNQGIPKVQGLINLLDCREEDGGFHTVPGFQKHLFEWCRQNKGLSRSYDGDHFVEVPPNDPMRTQIQRIPMRAGSLLIWDSQLPHGNYPNDSSNFRMVQYVKMFPARTQDERYVQTRREALKRILPPLDQLPLSEEAAQVLGLSTVEGFIL